MPRLQKNQSMEYRFPLLLWIILLLVLAIIFTFPRWITVFYPLPHRDVVFKYSQEYKVDPYLIFAIIRVESRFETEATSPRGARGLMQIMPDTARWSARQLGMKGFVEDQLTDPEVNICLGCWYVSELNREFQGRTPLVVAAYNAGRGNVREWLIADIWDGESENLDRIPFPETRNHVKRVLYDYEIYHTVYGTRGVHGK